ncbi:MAG TPA: gamma-glutamyltransferase [Steroidobacteraceae bacterium]|jgi:gamma-glutamyltranspeptidase/glutathione hydrolase|nr:gamma-glutamyltransferase [Steroidobacteraceae bacterium]
MLNRFLSLTLLLVLSGPVMLRAQAPETLPSPPAPAAQTSKGETPPPAVREAQPAAAATPSAARSWFRRHRHRGLQPWVAAANPLAVDAGIEILKRGGKALDAAVAVQAMLGLVEPQSSGVAGGAFLMYYDAHSGKLTAFDGREKAPAGARPDMFLDEHGKPLSYVEAVRSGRSTGVPGVMAMLWSAHRKFGALHWQELFQPAIRSASQGFTVPARLAMFLGEGSPFPPTNEVRNLFSRPDGDVIEEGDLFQNLQYAHTLEAIARDGPRGLYEGEIAEEIVRTTHQAPLPGTMTDKDLSSYRAETSEPLCRPYRDYSVCVPPPPSSGVSLLEMLAILERTDIAARRPSDPQAWFLFAQASRLIYADRDRYVGDPHFVPVPVERLLDPAYVRLRAQLIGEHAGPAPPPGDIPLPRGRDATAESAGTSHFVVVDADGDVVSMTTTVESIFGSGRTVGGFVLNNQLTDFSFVPMDGGQLVANAVQGGKRPRSSMAPVIVLDHTGDFVAAVGSPGGSAILEYNAKALVALLAWKMPLKQAIELPNLIARGDTFSGEVTRFSPAVLAGLRERGIELKSGHAENSGLHGVVRLADGSYTGAADSRREGVAHTLAPSLAPATHAAVH